MSDAAAVPSEKPAPVAETKPLVMVVVNKWWECDPVVNVLLSGSGKGAPGTLPWPAILNHPHHHTNPSVPGPPDPGVPPRLVYDLAHCTVEVWCISDLLENLPDKGDFQSSSERKAARLPDIFRGKTPTLVIAVGTAATAEELPCNGCVLAGTYVFMHDGKPNGSNPASRWTEGPFDTLVPSSLPAEAFSNLTALGADVSLRLLPTPNAAASSRFLLAHHDFTAVGNVNVTSYADYAATDKAASAAFAAAGTGTLFGTLETTHGLIRIQSDAPFMFVSGVTDRVGHFDDEVGSREYAQNFVAAHNMGVAVAWLLPRVDAAVGTGMLARTARR